MCMSSLIAPTRPRRLSFENSKRLEEASTDYMDAERDIKPFVFPTVPTTIQRNFHGPGARQPTARPLERCGTRVLPQTHRPCSAPRLSRKFWGAGDYDAVAGRSAPQPPSLQNRMCVHPEFLHSNATSHKWPFGVCLTFFPIAIAMAELLDNAVDEIETGGATTILLDKLIDKRNGSPALLIQDDGGGMDPDSLRRCMSFGFSEKQSGSSIGQYGNGFKTSTMRLGADAIVFSRCCTRSSGPTQSIGLLSYTFLVETGHTNVVVPMVDYKCNLMNGQTQRLERHGSKQFFSNLSALLKWSPFATEEELMQNFCDIGPHGTKIIVFNLWSNDDGNLELDFDTNPEDIMISGAPNPEQISNSVRRANENHLANRLRYSLRVYASVLYLQLPDYFRIMLRGREVERHHIASDLIYPERISYRPQSCGIIREAEVLTTIGFLKGAPTISVHGFNIYHKNRLILPFHRVLSTASSKGRSVSGVLEVDFIKPTHDKQDFEKSQLFQRLMNRLKEMTNEYWDLYSNKIGYVKVPRVRAAPTPAPPVMLAIENGPAEPSERSAPAPTQPLRWQHGNSNCVNAVPIAMAPPAFHPAPVKTETDAPGAPTGYAYSYSPSWPSVQAMQIEKIKEEPSMAAPGTDWVETRKRTNDDGATTVALFKRRKAPQELAGSGSRSATDQVSRYVGEGELNEFCFLKMENRMLRGECSEFEMAEKELRVKEQNLRLEIETAREQFKRLLGEYVSFSSMPTRKP
ncbi:Protein MICRORCHIDIA 6 [Zea mays]|uniref:Protein MICRORCHIDIA 6 n=1 Tax=Zea mays TaxID=4577 RepID=A0A3L6DR71_MAIZE|nr:Protein MICRORCHIDIA 6 [Zea mays]